MAPLSLPTATERGQRTLLVSAPTISPGNRNEPSPGRRPWQDPGPGTQPGVRLGSGVRLVRTLRSSAGRPSAVEVRSDGCGDRGDQDRGEAGDRSALAGPGVRLAGATMGAVLVIGLVGRGEGAPPTRLDLRAGSAWVASP